MESRKMNLLHLIEHPQLGPSLIHNLPLGNVVRNLQLANTKLQSIVEDVLVESYIQGRIQNSGSTHRLHPQRPHFWIPENCPLGVKFPAKGQAKTTLDSYFLKLLRCPGSWPSCMKVNIPKYQADACDQEVVLPTSEREERKKRFVSSQKSQVQLKGRPEITDPEATSMMQKLRTYLIDHVFTSELKRIGPGSKFRETAEPLGAKEYRHSAIPTRNVGEEVNLPQDVNELPTGPFLLRCLYEAYVTRQVPCSLEVLPASTDWLPEFISAEDMDQYHCYYWIPEFKRFLAAATKLKELKFNWCASSHSSFIAPLHLPVENLLEIVNTFPQSLESLILDGQGIPRADMDHYKVHSCGLEPSTESVPSWGNPGPPAAALDVVLLPLAKALVKATPNLTSLGLPKVGRGYGEPKNAKPGWQDQVITLTDTLVSTIGAGFPKLRILDLRGIYNSLVTASMSMALGQQITKHLPHLTALSATWFASLGNTDFPQEFLQRWEHTQLQYLDVGFLTFGSGQVHPCPLITPATVSRRYGSATISVAQSIPQLQRIGPELRTFKCKVTSNQELEKMLRCLNPAARGDAPNDDDNSREAKLISLDIELAISREEKRSNFTEAVGTIIATYCPMLQSLTLADHYYEDCCVPSISEEEEHDGVPILLSDSTLLNLAACRELRHLNVSEMAFSVQSMLCCCKTQWPYLRWFHGNLGRPDQKYHSTLEFAPFPADLGLCVPTYLERPNLVEFKVLASSLEATKRPRWAKEFLRVMTRNAKHLMEPEDSFDKWWE